MPRLFLGRRRRALAASALCLSLAGCAASPQNTTGTSGRVGGKLTVQASGGESEIKALQQLVAAFEAANPGTTVQLVPVASQGEHVAKLAAAFAAGRPPDVFLLNYRRFGQFAARKAIAPIEESLGDLKKDDFYEPPLRAFTVDGKLLCLPQNVSSPVIYTNPKLFQKAGVALPKPDWTWADMSAAARALDAAGVEAIGFGIGTRTVAPFVWSAGGEIVDNTERPTKFTLGDEPGRRALQFLFDLQRYGVDATERAAEDPEDVFARGELAMFYDSRRAVPNFRKSNVAFDVAPLPRDKKLVSLLASDGYCVADKSGNKATAAAFARFAVGPNGGKVLAETGRTVPSLKALAESPAFLDPSKPPRSARVFLDVIPMLRQLPSVAAQSEAEDVADEVLEQYFAGKLSLAATVARIEKDTSAAYAQQR